MHALSGAGKCAQITATLLLMALPGIALELRSISPPNAATNVCSDTLLNLQFDEPCRVATNGTISICNAADGSVVDVIDLASPKQTNLYGTKTLNYLPVRAEGSNVLVQLHSGRLTSGQKYEVRISPGVLTGNSSTTFKGFGKGEWFFATRPALAKGRTRLEVAPDSLGDFCTLQGAVDYIPEDNFAPTEIYVRKGVYDGIAYLGPGRNQIRVVGEDRKGSILTGVNNDRMNSGRMMRPLISVDADDVSFENLTLRNTTPYRGSQAEALRVDGQRCTLKNCDFYSYQDTLLLGGRVYVADCYVEGDVDFIWGHGTTFFDRCELKAMHDGYYVTSRNPEQLFGFVFNQCKLTAAAEVKRCWLARIETGRFPFSAVAFIRCQMGPHVPEAGWQVSGQDTNRLQFLEFQSTTPDGKLLNVSKRHPASKQISEAQAQSLSDPNTVLSFKDSWKPK